MFATPLNWEVSGRAFHALTIFLRCKGLENSTESVKNTQKHTQQIYLTVYWYLYSHQNKRCNKNTWGKKNPQKKKKRVTVGVPNFIDCLLCKFFGRFGVSVWRVPNFIATLLKLFCYVFFFARVFLLFVFASPSITVFMVVFL